MRDEPLVCDQENVSMSPRPHQPSMSRTYALPRRLGARSPCNLSALVVPSSRRATPSLGRLRRNLTRSGHHHEPRSTTVRFALDGGGSVTLFINPRQLPRYVLDHADFDQADRHRPLDQKWWGILGCSRLARALNDPFCHGWLIPRLSSLSACVCESPQGIKKPNYTDQSQSSREYLGVEESDYTR